MTRLRIAVVGVGSLGQHHAAKLNASPHADLVGVVDPSESAGREVAERNSCPWYRDADALPTQLDGVIIATPTVYHFQAAAHFLKRGIAAFVEKPLAASTADADELWRMAAEHDAILQVGHIERFNPAFTEMAERCDNPLYIRAQRVAPYTFRSTDIGVVHDLMIHDIDLVLALTSQMPTSVEAFGAVGVGPHEDMAVARLKMPSGTVVDITSSRMSPTAQRDLQVWCGSGCIQADLQTRLVRHWQPNSQLKDNPGLIHAIAAATADPRTLKDRVFGDWIQAEEIQGSADDALALEQTDFMEAIRGEHSPRVGGREGVNALLVADQVLEALKLWSYQTGGAVGAAQSHAA